MSKRVGLSKSLRFRIFARDGFTCRYCGRQSDQVALQVDHVIPIAEGGDNNEANLVTACFECNLGKGAKLIKQAAPTETDRLRLAQEMQEQVAAAKAVIEARKARETITQMLVNFWCGVTGRDSVNRSTVNTIICYVHEFDFETVAGWIERAAGKVGTYDDRRIGKYVSGIRRTAIKDRDEDEAPSE